MTNHLVDKLTDALLAGDAPESELVLQEAYLNKFSAMDIYESVFCLLYTSPSPRDGLLSRMPSSA